MSTVIPAPLSTCGFPIFSHSTSVIVITSGQAGDAGVNHWGMMGVPSFLSPGIHIYKVCRLPREHLLLVTRAALIQTGCPDVRTPNLSLPNPQRKHFFSFCLSLGGGCFWAFGLEMLMNGTPCPHYTDVLSLMARPARAPSESSRLNAKPASFDKSRPNKKKPSVLIRWPHIPPLTREDTS